MRDDRERAQIHVLAQELHLLDRPVVDLAAGRGPPLQDPRQGGHALLRGAAQDPRLGAAVREQQIDETPAGEAAQILEQDRVPALSGEGADVRELHRPADADHRVLVLVQEASQVHGHRALPFGCAA